MTEAISGFGTALIWNNHKVLELTNISGPSQSMETVDVTNHDSLDAYREFIGGAKSGGEISIEGNFIPGDEDGQGGFLADLQDREPRACWIVMPMSAAAALYLTALAKGFETSFPIDNKIGVSGSLQVIGKPILLTTQSAGMSARAGIEQTDAAALVITPAAAVGTYIYECSVNTASAWVKLTITAATHTIYVLGVAQTSGVQGGEVALGAAGTVTDIIIMVYEANKAPRLYVLRVTRPLP